MDEQHIPHLIDKYIAGTATKEERNELLDWYRSAQHDEIYWPEEKAVFEERITRVFLQIKQTTNLTVNDCTPVKRIFPWRLIAIAATFLVVIGVATISLTDRSRDVTEHHALQHDEIQPGGHKAVLVLGNGQAFTLGDSVVTFETADQETFIEQNGELLFRAEGQAVAASTYNELVTPKGGQYVIQLADGSKVSLNSESSLSFPTRFTGNERKVILDGEAYFEVAENTAQPFIVSMPEMEVEVFGTTFNVKGYQDEDNIATTLLEGSVKVRSGNKEMLLKPGQSAILNKKNGVINAEKANVTEEIAWTKGYFVFSNKNIKNIMSQLSRWYDVQVIYQGDMTDKIYSGKILRRSNITEVLNMLEETGTITFQITGRRVVVMP